MNELKQIRSMAEMILEKVTALEGAKSEFKPVPKFKVGDRVRIEELVAKDEVAPVGTVVNVYMGSSNTYDIAIIDDPRFGSGNRRKMVWEKYLTKVEAEREWHSGPPPHVGWWNASQTKHNESWRWWNGSSWSMDVHQNDGSAWAGGHAMWVETAEINAIIKWTDYWPENARVPRINPKTVNEV